MNDIITVAQSTFERVARLKSLYVILLICILDVAAMGLYDELSMRLDQQMMRNAALAIVTVVALLTAMVAAFEVPRELREKTAQFILTKPMGRSSFVWGKFLGVGALVVFNVAIITVGSILVYQAEYEAFAAELIYGGLLVAGEGLVLAGVGLVLSMFLADWLAAIGVFVTFALGHAVFVLPRLWETGFLHKVGAAVSHVFPNFYHLDIKTEIASDMAVPSSFVWWGLAYAVCYALALTGLATLIFNRKDIG
jgi:ABC-type transport system involved in multi-copper enzyme maturation permease subunit